MKIDEQVKIMETQLAKFDSLEEKKRYLAEVFVLDRKFSTKALALVLFKLYKGKNYEY